MSKISYHTRLEADSKVKVSGGTFGGTVDYETVNRLAKAFFEVVIKPSGRAVFVDKGLREVRIKEYRPDSLMMVIVGAA